MNPHVKSCLHDDSKNVNLIFKSDRLETCFVKDGNSVYSIELFPGTDKIRYVIRRSNRDDSYYTVYFKKHYSCFIDKHNVSLNERIILKNNRFGGYDYNVHYHLHNLKSQVDIFNLSTDSLNQLLPEYCYYEYDKKKNTYKYISELLTENAIKNDSLVFKYFEVDNLNDLTYIKNRRDGTIKIKSSKKKNSILTKDLTFNQGSSKALVGELHVYFKKLNQQLDSINLLLVFQGDLQARMTEFNHGSNELHKKFRSNEMTKKKKICNELKKFGITFRNDKAIMSEPLISALDI